MENAAADSKTNYAPHIALFLTQLMFGSAAVVGKAALAAFPSYAIVGFRVGGAALAFGFLQKLNGNFRLDKRIHYLHFAFFSLFGVIVNQLLFFKGLSLTTAANTSLLAVMIPVFAIVISAAIGNDQITRWKICGVILASAGVIYLINPANASFSSETTRGDVLIILNSFSYAVYIATSKKLITHYGALKSIAWVFIMASVINVPVGLISLSSVNLREVPASGWLALSGVVISSTILAYYWNAWALARVEPSVVAVYTYLQPLIGFMLAVFFLGEHFTSRLLLSAVLIFTGVFLVTRKRKREVISKL
jgi:drug/metabolite transporter (DMT)-like permease